MTFCRYCVLILLTFAAWLPSASALDCPTANVYGFSGSSQVIHVYMEDSFAVEMRACNNFALPIWLNDDSLPTSGIEAELMRAIHLWNTQGNGPFLKYEGTTGADTAELACSSGMLQKRPAVFVQFSPGAGTGGKKGAIANVGTINTSGCSDVAKMNFFGSEEETLGEDETCANNPSRPDDIRIFTTGSQYDTYTGDDYGLASTFKHEFGHVMGLGHAIDSSDNPKGSVLMFGRQHACVLDTDCEQSVCSDGLCECDTNGSQNFCYGSTDPCSDDSDCGPLDYCAGYLNIPGKACFDSNGRPKHNLELDSCGMPGQPVCECMTDAETCETDQQPPANDIGQEDAMWDLWKWDRECSAQNSATRQMTYQMKVWDDVTPHPSTIPSTTAANIPSTNWGTWGGPAWKLSSNSSSRYYPLLRRTNSYHRAHRSYAGTDGTLVFAYIDYLSSIYKYSMGTVRRAPYAEKQVLVSELGLTGFASELRPPPVRALSYNATSSTWSSDYLDYCTATNIFGNCVTTDDIRTGRPPSSAIDPETGLEIMAVTSNTGEVTLFVGQTDANSFGKQYALSEQKLSWLLSNNGGDAVTPTPEGLSDWAYIGRTDGFVGLACGDASKLGLAYNCIIAWVDAGAPNGQILYTYFRPKVDSTTNSKGIDWFTFFGQRAAWELKSGTTSQNGV